MSISTDDRNYAAAKTAQNFFRDAVDFCLKGNRTDLENLIDEYLKKNSNVNSQDLLLDFKSEGKTLMHVAASGGHAVIIDYLITLLRSPSGKKNLINSSDDKGFTPLINATVSESDVIMSTLISNGADVNSVNKDGAGAVHFAAGDGSVSRLSLLTNAGANIKGMSQSGTPLHWAAGKGRAEAIKFLVEKGGDIDLNSSTGLPAVLMAAVSSCDEGVRYLVQRGADVGQLVSGNITVLHISAEHGLIAAVKALVKTEMGRKCCGIQTSEGNLPVQLAAMAGHRSVVEVLLPLSLSSEWEGGVNPSSTIDDVMANGAVRMAAWEKKASEDRKKEAKKEEEERSGVVSSFAVEPTTPSASPEAEVESDFWKRRGNEAFVVKEYKKASDAYSSAIKLKGDSGTLWSNRSACYLAMGEPYLQRALSDAEICRRLMPAWPKACFRLAKARLALKMYEDAAVAAFEGCKLDDSNIDLKNLLREAVAMGKEEHQRKIASGEIPVK